MRQMTLTWPMRQSQKDWCGSLLNKTISKLVSCLLLLSIHATHAQSIAVDPVTQSASQATAPGLAYTPEQMWKRLIAIAEGPIPTREELEKEFGFTFRFWGKEAHEKEGNGTYYGAVASPPFGTPHQPQGNNISYRAYSDSTSVVFYFEPKRVGFNKTDDRYCVENEYLFKALTGKWVRNKKERWHSPIVVDYTATFNGITRSVEVSPLYLSADSYPCLKNFYIDYIHPTAGTQK